jgi:hypothetical protein
MAENIETTITKDAVREIPLGVSSPRTSPLVACIRAKGEERVSPSTLTTPTEMQQCDAVFLVCLLPRFFCPALQESERVSRATPSKRRSSCENAKHHFACMPASTTLHPHVKPLTCFLSQPRVGSENPIVGNAL